MNYQPSIQTNITHTNDRLSAIPTPNRPQPGDGHPVHRPMGKIARLPAEHRELFDLILHHGAPYGPIIKKLVERGHTLSLHQILNILCKLTEGSIRCERRNLKVQSAKLPLIAPPPLAVIRTYSQ